MKKNLVILKFLLLPLVFASCNGTTDKALKSAEIFVDFNKEIKEIDLCQCLDTAVCEMIVLETSEESLIGEATKIVWHNDTLVICDSQSKSVLLFNKEGKFLSKICRFGRSGQEYMDAYDFFIDRDEIIILDNRNDKILSYDFSGKFKYSFEIESGLSVCKYNGKIFVYGGWAFDEDEQHPVVFVYNQQGENEMNYLNITKEGAHNHSCKNHFFSLSYGFSMFNNDNYTMYKYTNNQFVETYSFNFGDKAMPYKYKKRGAEYILKNGYHKKYVSGISQMWESDRFILCDVLYDDYHTMVYDKKNGNLLLGKLSSYDKFGIFRGSTSIDGEYIYSYQTGSQISTIRSFIWNQEGSILKKEEKKLKGITESLNDTDNGVVIRMKLKGYDED